MIRQTGRQAERQTDRQTDRQTTKNDKDKPNIYVNDMERNILYSDMELGRYNRRKASLQSSQGYLDRMNE